jgi:cytochrome oxidase Cu insertion factor (SCO1/SenC/PrrC family)
MNRLFLISLILSVLVVLPGCAPQTSPSTLAIGSTAPAFTLEDALGGQISLADYQGTPVLLFFHMAVG